MTFNEYQEAARRTQNKTLRLYDLRQHALYGLASEVGEVLGMHQKYYQGHVIDDTALRLEIGDVLWFVAELCDVEGWDMDEIAMANIQKLRNRYPVKFTPEQSIERRDTKENGPKRSRHYS